MPVERLTDIRPWRRCGLAFAVAGLLLLPMVRAAGARGPQLAAGSGQPIQITADSGLEWQQKAQIYVAHGHARAKRGDMSVEADRLIAHYRKVKDAAGGTEIYRVAADGHVVIRGPKDTITGDHAVYDLDRQIAIVTGKHLRLTTAKDVVTARDSLEWYDGKDIAVARGDAAAREGDKRIRADVLTAYLSKSKVKGDKSKSSAMRRGPADGENSQIRRVDASGNVLISTPKDVARGDYGVYDARTGIVTLLGHVTITRGKNAIRGQYAVMDLNTDVARIMSPPGKRGVAAAPVEGIFVRSPGKSAAPAGTRTASPHAVATQREPKR